MSVNKNQSPQARSLISDSLTQAETVTTRSPTNSGNKLPVYLRNRPVKFRDIPAGACFFLNGTRWRKNNSNSAITCEAGRPSTLWNISPEEFVFLIQE